MDHNEDIILSEKGLRLPSHHRERPQSQSIEYTRRGTIFRKLSKIGGPYLLRPIGKRVVGENISTVEQLAYSEQKL